MTVLCVTGEWTQPDPAGSDEGATRQSLSGGGTSFHPVISTQAEVPGAQVIHILFLSAVIKRHLLCPFLGTERRRQGPLEEETGNRCDHAGWYVLRGELFSFSEPYFCVWIL